MKMITWVEFIENIMFRKLRIQVCYVADVTDAVTEAADLKISLGKGLNVLDFLSPVYEKNVWCVSAYVWESEGGREERKTYNYSTLLPSLSSTIFDEDISINILLMQK